MLFRQVLTLVSHDSAPRAPAVENRAKNSGAVFSESQCCRSTCSKGCITGSADQNDRVRHSSKQSRIADVLHWRRIDQYCVELIAKQVKQLFSAR